jgi:hypothetical protein
MRLDAEYLRMQNEWFFKWHHIGGDSVVEIDGFDGRMIRYGGIKALAVGRPRSVSLRLLPALAPRLHR